MQTEDQSLKPNPAWKIAIVGLPLFLVVSGVVSIVLSVTKRPDDTPDPRLALQSAEVGAEELDEHLRKLSVLIGPRDWETPAGRANMRYAQKFIESMLSPQNYGFVPVTGEHVTYEEERWPTVWADLKGTVDARQVIIVPAPYDLGDAAVAVVLAAANDLRDEELGLTVRFVFYPAALYAAGEGKDLADVVKNGESRIGLVLPDLPAEGGEPPKPGIWSGAQLKPVAQRLVEKVRELAGEDGKMP